LNNLNYYKVLGLKIDLVNQDKVYELLKKSIKKNHSHFITFRDVASLMRIKDDNELLDIQNNEVTISCADGWPIALIGRIHKKKFQRVTGPDFFKRFIENNKSGKHFLIGSSVQELIKIKNKILLNNKIEIVGLAAPKFNEINQIKIKRLANEIKKSEANIVWVGISSPKQELLISMLKKEVKINYCAVGAALDFYSSKQKRAPKILRKLYLEWLYRLINSPKRLWKRYLILSPKFVILVFYNLAKQWITR